MKTTTTFMHAKRVLVTFILMMCLIYSPQKAYSQGWSPVGSGLAGWVYALTVYNGQLIAGGTFPGYIAKFNGTNWETLGSGLSGKVWSLTVYNGSLIAGGEFIDAGTVNVNYIAKWDGSSWIDLEGGTDNIVASLTVFNSKLIAGGYFTTANISANYIASWDGSSWAPLGDGMGGVEGQVMALDVYNGNLIAGGFFTTAGGMDAYHLAKWNGSSWSSLGSGIDNIVYSLANYGTDLIVGGLFSFAGGVSASSIASWNGSSWNALGSGMGPTPVGYNYVFALTVYGNYLIAGGMYETAGGLLANGIAAWNGSNWYTLDGGVYNSGANAYGVNALTIYSNAMIAGGIFTTAGGIGAGNIAQWTGTVGINTSYPSDMQNKGLSQIYPNPVSSVAHIRYNVTLAGRTELTVFDQTGHEIEKLVDCINQPGNYNIDFNATKYSSGNYYYTLKIGASKEIKNIQILK